MRTKFGVSQTTDAQYDKEESKYANLTREMYTDLSSVKFKIDEVQTNMYINRVKESVLQSKQNSNFLQVSANKRPKIILPKLSRKELLADYYKTGVQSQLEIGPYNDILSYQRFKTIKSNYSQLCKT